MKLLDAVDSLKIWRRGDQRAPHKPLLLLYALAKELKYSETKFEFSKIEDDLNELLNEFWKPRNARHSVENPFWRLQTDKIWRVDYDWKLEKKNPDNISASWLRKQNAVGTFSPEISQEIKDNPDIARQAAQKLLDAHFSESLHQSILESTGLFYTGTFSNSKKSSKKARRNPKFRENVLHTYSYRCAICGFSLHMKTMPVGLEAAHIKWHQSGGPDTEDNGLALCATHHRLFDSGVMTLSQDYRIILSKWAYDPRDESNFIDMHQKRILKLPRNKRHLPKMDYINWHRKEVFKEPEIYL